MIPRRPLRRTSRSGAAYGKELVFRVTHRAVASDADISTEWLLMEHRARSGASVYLDEDFGIVTRADLADRAAAAGLGDLRIEEVRRG